ncbi:hypothetical protein DXG03_008286, partial [Asterophora parasitica]
MKASSSSSAAPTKKTGVRPQAKAAPKEKEKAAQPLQNNTSIKKQMKPKGKLQPKQKPVPVPILVQDAPPGEPEAEDLPPSPPANTFHHPSRPSTPHIVDVSMESIPDAT